MLKKNKLIILIGGTAVGGFVSGWKMKTLLTPERLAKKIDNLIFGKDNEFIFDSLKTAEQVLDGMNKILQNYGHVTVGDFKNLVCSGATYMRSFYGWADLSSATITARRKGPTLTRTFVLSLPKPQRVKM